MGVVGVTGLILMASPTAGAVVAGILSGLAGLVLFAAVVLGKFDPPSRR